MKRLILVMSILSVLFLGYSCNNKDSTKVDKEPMIENLSDNLLNATAWFQQSSEAYAAYVQTFNLAKRQLEINLQNASKDSPKAVIVDIDETMLDNSPFEGYLIKNGLEYNHDNWKSWVSLSKAKPIPGALDFVNFVKENKLEVFYISNRSVNDFEATLRNLKDQHFPFADSTHLMLKDTISDKTPRRELVAKTHEVLLLMGDNLRDLSEDFKSRSTNFGKNLIDEKQNLLGTKYFILPNPMYGEWMKAYRNNGSNSASNQKIENMRKAIEAF